MQHDPAEIRALQREGHQYIVAGMLDRAKLVNEQLAARGVDPLVLPKQSAPAPATRQKRVSTQAATRQKRGS